VTRGERLSRTAAIVDALLGIPDPGRAEARQLVIEFDTPVAIFEPAAITPHFASRSWDALLISPSAPLVEAMQLVMQSGVPRVVDELELAAPACCSVALRPVPHGVIVALELTTDLVLARRLGASDAAILFSGALANGPDYTNARWVAYAGAEAARLRSWRAAIHRDDVARWAVAIGEATRRQIASDVEVRLRRADGNHRWHQAHVQWLAGRWYATATDVHDVHVANDERLALLATARAARADAEEATRHKDQFLATVSHELRAPVTTMLLWERILSDPASTEAVRAQALAAIHDSALAQQRLVGDLLDVSRAMSGKLFVDLRRLDIAHVSREALLAAAPAAEARGVILESHGLDAGIEIAGDAIRFRQVLDNLLSNAVKFSAYGGRVVLGVRATRKLVVVEIADTGRGIEPGFLPKLFEPFSQADDALTRHAGGLGLGLTISRSIIELHDGTLEAISQGLGHGATLRITLPGARRTATPAIGVPLPHTLHDLDVLVVDDDGRVRDALAVLLARTGASVRTAASAAGAWAMIGEAKPDVIVCDLAMPVEDGYSFMARLRKAHNTIPAIALTAHATPSDVERSLVAGFDLHLAKPIDFERLVTNIEQLVAR